MIDPERICMQCMKELNESGKVCPHCGFDNASCVNTAHQLACGSILAGAYLVGCVLGQGGFGITYIGYDLNRNERVAILCANWHRDIDHQARDAAVAEFARNGLPPSQVVHYEVPGAFEIPLLAKKLARSGRYDAIVACALVVNGGIYRHEFVTSAVIDGMMRVQLDTEVPVLSAVLTPRDFHEHEDHLRFYREHFVKKGVEVAQACLATLDNLGALVESGSE